MSGDSLASLFLLTSHSYMLVEFCDSLLLLFILGKGKGRDRGESSGAGST